MERAELDQWKSREVARLLALVEAERRYYQDLVASLPVGLLIVSSQLEIISANRAFRRIFGFSREDLLGKDASHILPAEGLAGAIAQVLEGRSPRCVLVWNAPAELTGRRFRLTITALRGWEGEYDSEALLVLEDLTEAAAGAAPAPVLEAKAEPAPAALREEPEAPVEPAPQPPPVPLEVPAAVWEADPSTLDIRLLNPADQEILGQPASAQSWWERVAEEDRDWLRARLSAISSIPGIFSHEYRAKTAAGRLVWLYEVVEVPAARGARLRGLAMEATAARAARQSRQQFETADTLSRLTARLTHDFNNLLMVIMGYGEDLLHSFPGQDPRRADVNEILHTAERVSASTRELMAMTRPPVAQTAVIDVNATVDLAVTRAREDLPSNLRLVFEPAPDLGPVVADPWQLAEIVITLIEQCSALAEPGTAILLRSSAAIGTHAVAGEVLKPHHVCLTVEEQGVAVAGGGEDLFDPLYTRKEFTRGPGLFRVLALVRQAGGYLHVESEPGVGTRFVLTLPRKDQPPEAAPPPPRIPPAELPATGPAAEPSPEAPGMPRRPPAAMLVEDDAGIRALMRKILGRHGFTVVEAGSGEEALRLSGEHEAPLDLLVTDLTMPGMNGRELSERLLAARPKLKILYVSGYTDDPNVQAGLIPEGASYLQKPFTLGALVEKVREVMGGEMPS